LEGGSGVCVVFVRLGASTKTCLNHWVTGGWGADLCGLVGLPEFGSVRAKKLDVCQEEQFFQRGPQLSVNPARSPLRPLDWTNIVGTLHGAASAWIVDT
jgi:hypothetical protein